MKRLFALLLVPCIGWAQSLKVLMPVYQTERASVDMGHTISSQLPRPLDQIPPVISPVAFNQIQVQLNRNFDEPTLFEIPAHFLKPAMAAGWTPIYRIKDTSDMAWVTTSDNSGQVDQVSTPPRATLAYWTATQMTPPDSTLVPTASHALALRALVTGESNSAVAAKVFAQSYADRFDIELNTLAEYTIPPSVIVRNNAFDKLALAALNRPEHRIETPVGATFIPFVPERDLPLYENIPDSW